MTIRAHGDDNTDDHHRLILDAFAAAELSTEELWLRYFGLGGDAGKLEIEAFLSGLMPLHRIQQDMIAHAINERLDELEPPRAPYHQDGEERDAQCFRGDEEHPRSSEP
ncbi:hypothetical protein [Rhodococcus sp. NPDC058521]|uniref:hypothetical protein n=1 Tax=Rhodococcus sp. NPDC058521 TaxID=3346536 RepID=UPI0036671B31